MPGNYRFSILALCLLGLFTVIFLFYRESRLDRVFGAYQKTYQQLNRTLSTSTPPQFSPEIAQRSAMANKDHCPICHLGIREKPLPHAVANPYRNHPGKLLAQHDPQTFGCTRCHGAGGEYLDRCLPSRGDTEGKALNQKTAQSSCASCHEPVEGLAGAEKITKGLRVYRKLGCGGCHQANHISVRRLLGPPLDLLPQKLRPEYVRSFLADPQQIRPNTSMPSFFSEDLLRGAPSYTASRLRQNRDKDIRDLLSFLYPTAVSPSTFAASIEGDKKIGKTFFNQIGCKACHLNEDPLPLAADPKLGRVGPDLQRVGDRLAPAWLEAWLSSPIKVFPDTRMPNFRLNKNERAHLLAYLESLGHGDKAKPDQRPNTSDAQAFRRGKSLAERLGCSGCHMIKELQGAPLAGPELDGFGDKPFSLLDWGHAPVPSPQRNVWLWTKLKLSQPLIFDRRPGVLIMPWQSTKPDEQEALALLLKSLTTQKPPARFIAQPSISSQQISGGERWIEEFSCGQCHSLASKSGYIGALYPLIYDRPPSLVHQGNKVQPSWLYDFLTAPTALRPWLSLRMPTPAMNHEQIQTVAAYFANIDKASYPFVKQPRQKWEGERLSQALTLFRRFQCVRCHLVSNAPSLKPGEISPDLSLSFSRLRRSWIRQFITEPQAVIPGTKMPTLFPLADEDDPQSRMTPLPQFFNGRVDEQIEVLTDLNLWWGTSDAARQGYGVNGQ